MGNVIKATKNAAIARILTEIPTALRDGVEQTWESFIDAANENGLRVPEHPDFIKAMFRVWAMSDFVAQHCMRYPELIVDFLDSGDLLGDYRADEYRVKLHELLGNVDDQQALEDTLREFRQREMIRIAWRDLAGWASLEETMRDLSALADACLNLTTAILHHWQCQEVGVPTGERNGKSQSLIIIAMGKLGARELNFSSDVDLIFTYPEEGYTRRSRTPVSNEEYFTDLGRRLVNTLHTVTDKGFVFRVDMRLRPFGESGPLVTSFDAAEDYYQSQGREWERYAMIKARPVAGDRSEGERFMAMMRPFVYRRYLDFGTFQSLREMKAMIGHEVERKGLQDNIKLGSGGIREVEFIGQALQLIWGGRNPKLRERSILPVLQHLSGFGYLPAYVARNLISAYVFLRRLENRLQAFADEQVHSLPADEADQSRVAYAMGFPDWESFSSQLTRHRRHVSNHFEQVFLAPQINDNGRRGETHPAAMSADITTIWSESASDEMDNERALEVLGSSGFKSPGDAFQALGALRDSYAYRSLSARGRERMDHLIPLLLGAVAETEHRDRVLLRLLDLIESIASREVYLALLVENPMALSQLVKLCAASPWISELLASHPILLDELLDPRALYAPLDRAALENQLQIQLDHTTAGDLEVEMDTLRHFKQANVLRVAAADVMGIMPLMVVSDRLTEIAEVILDKVMDIAVTHVETRSGKANVRRKSAVGFAIVGYGKLGGIELGYGSDLDLVFLHESPASHDTEQSVLFARLGQRIIHILNTHTPAGVLYEVDMRLRPSGASGLLVSSIDAFEDYQRHDAWTWEIQALVRARVITGDDEIKRRFEAVRRGMLSKERDPQVLRREVREMRERMRNELSQSGPGYFDIKQDRGGIADIEFIVQYSVLLWASRHPGLLLWTDNIRLLEELAKADLLAQGDVQHLSDCYRTYRSCVHRMALQEEEAVVDDMQFTNERDAVSRIWNQLLGD